MHRVVVLMALLSRVGAPDVSTVDSPNTLQEAEATSASRVPTTMSSPTLPSLRSSVRLATVKPRRKPSRQGKADSPMLNYIFDSYATSNKHFHDKQSLDGQDKNETYSSNRLGLGWSRIDVFEFRAPSFESGLDSDTKVDADSGATVFFDCRVTSLRDKMVSWLRVSDSENLELLTLDLNTHTADSRYRVDLAGDNWRLELNEATVNDSGVYCCHVSTHPPMLRRVMLTVHPPEMKMIKEVFLETGETLSLKCAVLHLSPGEDTPQMHWVRGNDSVPLDEVRGGVLIETDHLTLTSQLQVAKLKIQDAGNYTCVLQTPIKMRSTARVHVLQGSSLAELQSGVKISSAHTTLLFICILFALNNQFTFNLKSPIR